MHLTLDASDGDQDYMEDCPVCCNAIHLRLHRDELGDKLLQYAARIWGLVDGEAEQRIDQAIHYTRDFFEALGVPTRLNAYQITAEAFPEVLRKLEEHGQTAMGEP